MSVNHLPSNSILAALSAADLAHVSPALEQVPLTFGMQLYRADEPIEHLYFPDAGIISLIAKADDSSLVEVGMLGREGVAGFSVALGVMRSVSVAIVQGTGTAYRLSANDFTEVSKTVEPLRQGVLRFVHSFMTQSALAAACNAYHAIDRRLARWLLMTHDRMQADQFQITQEFLSHMLGVRREAVNKAVGALRRTGFVDLGRGNMTILDRKGLESRACTCYAKIVAAYENNSN